ncbi:MAG: hypothetical protein ACRDRQ_05415 [Pseudonocardiaceae bacterium]
MDALKLPLWNPLGRWLPLGARWRVRVVWRVVSAGRCLRVAGPAELGRWWAQMRPQISGTVSGGLVPVAEPAQVTLPEDVTWGDTRRWINAHLHCGHLANDTVSVHGVAVAHDDGAVVLLGGHGAGKSLTGLALVTRHGWRAVAGDTVLIHLSEGTPLVVGGTGAYLVRSQETRGWFPELRLPLSGSGAVDISEQLSWDPRPGIPLVAVIQVAVHGGFPRDDPMVWCDGQTARNAWYRASGHLLDKVLDDHHADPLRLVETPELVRARIRLVRRLAASVGCGWLRGSPQRVGEAITRLIGAEE